MPTRTMGQLIAGLKDFRFRCMAGAAIQRPAHTANCLFIWLRRQARLEINRSLAVGNGYEEQKNKPQPSAPSLDYSHRHSGRGALVPVVTGRGAAANAGGKGRSEEHTSEIQSLMRASYALFC